VLIADDHVRTRRWVREALERKGIVVCGEAASAEASVDTALRERPDVCLLDINMPGNGINAAKEISTRLPATVVIMLTVSNFEQDISDSIRAGASGYFLKDMDPAKLGDALLAVLRSHTVPPEGPGRSRS
jgi:DNA-binding NarL/FixJ family response regulator